MSWKIEYIDRITKNIRTIGYDAMSDCYEAYNKLCNSKEAYDYIRIWHRDNVRAEKRLIKPRSKMNSWRELPLD